MKSFATILAAAAASAVVAAAITLPAGADQDSKDQPPRDEGAALSACLRAHGLDVPAELRGFELKQWIGSREGQADVQKALDECAGPPERKPAPAELVSCLTQHGLQPPADVVDLKRWMAQQSETAGGADALKACHINVGKDVEKVDHECGGPRPAAKGEAARKRAAAAARR